MKSDGSSNEGVGYWQYGLMNMVALAEMLRARTGGALDPLASPRLRQIAAYPVRMQLSGALFATFADCDETNDFNFGIIQRLAERTGETALLNLIAKPAESGAGLVHADDAAHRPLVGRQASRTRPSRWTPCCPGRALPV